MINGEETYDEVLVRTLQQLCGLEDELDLTDEHVRTLVNMMATSDVSDIMAKYTESNANQNQDGNITDTNNTSNEDSEPELRNKLICERIVRLLLKDSDTDSNDNNSLSHEARLHFGLSAAIILNQPNLINKFIHNYFEKMKAIKKPAKEDIATFLREVIDVVRKVFAERRAKYVNNYQGLFDAVRLGDAKLFKKALSKINGLDLSFVLANFGNPFTKSPLTVEHLTAELIQVSELSTDNKSKDHYRNKYVYVRPLAHFISSKIMVTQFFCLK
ncbi:MAG: hypothetical protein HWD59_14695 [Coxiellaceae bacterium]|nr:MAG: hypothetical protein HWD59_14695 [Coxiellaceae bacterium]